MDRAEALAIANDYVSHWAVWGPKGDIVVWKIDEHSRAWIAHFASERWLESRSFSDQLVGSSPLVIEKVTGQVHQYGSNADENARFMDWLDPETAEG